MIILTNIGPYRPGEDDTKDGDIFMRVYAHDNYIPSRTELMEDFDES